ncbi:MAG: hypothetical protein ACXABF_05895 [Candidatus Thorarchaeota archaeon]
MGPTKSLELVYLLLYRLRSMDDTEKREWLTKWATLRKKLPKGFKIITEAGNAFGTDFTGFTVFEGPFERFEELLSILELHSGDMVEKTKTIIGTKGIIHPTSEIEKILKSRPID